LNSKEAQETQSKKSPKKSAQGIIAELLRIEDSGDALK
jgi:hypothetical protein